VLTDRELPRAPIPGGCAPDRCPRCGAGFACGAAGPAPCACTGVALGAERLAALRQRYNGCLCPGCLAALAAGAPVGPEDAALQAGPEGAGAPGVPGDAVAPAAVSAGSAAGSA